MHSNAEEIPLLGACFNSELTLFDLTLYCAQEVVIGRIFKPT
jgi:hypothetical protein